MVKKHKDIKKLSGGFAKADGQIKAPVSALSIDRKVAAQFQRDIKRFARLNRRAFPWRNTKIPYRILVSEIMLQQTQTDRVVGYYRAFLKNFPTIKALSTAPLGEVIAAWQGLGYNRRARFLWQLSRIVVSDFLGRLPRDADTLVTLPGIGRYTANAVCVFAFDHPLPMIETNIRAVYIERFFKGSDKVRDADLMPLIEATIDRRNPREWFYALMDYGSDLKKRDRTITGKSAHYVKQSTFVGSRRQLRGIVLRLLVEKGSMSGRDLMKYKTFDKKLKLQVLEELCKESLIQKRNGRYRIAK